MFRYLLFLHAVLHGIVVPSRSLSEDSILAPAESWNIASPLRPGEKIALVAPAGPADREPVMAYVQILEKAGYVVQIPKNIDRREGYLAGSDQQRVDELNQAIRDPGVRAVMPVRGGFGLTRILDQVDYESLKRDPKIITGYSDLTALHLAIAKKAKLITFHSPMPISSLWKGDDATYQYANRLFRRTLFFDSQRTVEQGYLIPYPVDHKPEKLVGGVAIGRILGGNLSLVVATMGTPFEIEGDGTILFLEDVHEAPYRIDRMLSTLRLSGLLGRVKGVILGDFSPKPEDREDTDRVLKEYFGGLRVPVIWKFPVGHIPNNATIPHGALVELDANAGTLRVIDRVLRF